MNNKSVINTLEIKKIAILQTAFIGDTCLSLYLPKILKSKFPNIEIIFICNPNSVELVSSFDFIDIVFPYDKRKQNKGLSGLLYLVQKLDKLDVDLFISLHQSIRSSLMALLIDSKYKAVFDTASLSFLFKYKFKYEEKLHYSKRILSPLELFQINPIEINLNINHFRENIIYSENNKTISKVNEYNKEKIIAIAPGSVWKTKKWGSDKYKQLIEKLYNYNYKIVLIGSKEDLLEMYNIIDRNQIINENDEFSIAESIKIISMSNLLITNDSAPTHFASIMNVPAFTIYGPTAPNFGFSPIGENSISIELLNKSNLECRPCHIHGLNSCPLAHHNCMNKIEVDYIYNKIEDHFNRYEINSVTN